MKRKNTTRSALFTSIISLLLCVSMLVGTTFAWFTDEVKSGTNVIAAGNLDVDVLVDGESIQDKAVLFDEITLWEPGVVAYENLTVTNLGSLALKYQMSVNFDNATKNDNGDTLAKVLKVGVVEGGVKSTTRDGALLEVTGWQPLESFVKSGKLDSTVKDLTDAQTSDTYGIVIYWAPSDIDNEFNMNNGNQGKTMKIDLGIKLVATQLEAEEDSFGKDYDEDAMVADVLATPETIDEILATVEPGTVIGLTAGKYGTITLTQNNLTLVSNSAVVGQLDLNEKDGITVDGLTFDAATAQIAYNKSGTDSGYVANVTDGKFKNGGSVGVVIKNCEFVGTAVDSEKYIPVYFGDVGRANRSSNITIENCKFQTDAKQYVALNGVGSGEILIKNNVFGGNGFGTSHNTINGSTQSSNWTIIGNKFYSWGIQNAAIGSSRNAGDIITWNVIGNEFNSKNDAVVLALKASSYNQDNTKVVFENNTALDGKANIVDTAVDATGSDALFQGKKIEVIGDFTPVFDEKALDDALTSGGEIVLIENIKMEDGSAIHTHTSTNEIIINGNGKTLESSASSVDVFTWEGGTIPAMSTILSSENGSKVTVNDLSFSGTMSSIMLGHYVNATYNNYNTELNNVNVVGTKVVSFSSNIAPAVTVYGTAVLNNCNIYGTTLSELDTDPMWPVYDVAVVNYSDTVINSSKIGSLYMWNQAKVTVAAGTEIDEIVILGNMNTTKYGLTVKAGATVDAIDLSGITDAARINITIEDGATVSAFVDNGVSYATIEDWKAAQ